LTATLSLELRTKQRDAFLTDFLTRAHPHQLTPQRANSGQEWVLSLALNDPKARIALVGETEHEVREVMVEGVSGLLAVHSHAERPQWVSSRRRVEWNNGAVAQIFSAENYESLRGPQFSAAWCDELAKWRQVLGLGSTDPLGGDVAQWAMIVLTAYFDGRSLEKVARILARK
jgi:hypothetical protein